MARRKKGKDVHGWFVLDKPYDLTSTDAVARVRRLFDARKAGHAGTLDPLATGILPIALGEATKTVAWLMETEKVYRFTIAWGVSTDSQDAEGREIARSDARPAPEAIAAALPRYEGEIEQIPPAFSAIKVDGARAYDLARGGETVALAPRRVTLHAIRLVDAPSPDAATLEVRCGKGFYIRALVRDLARDLGCEGHVSMLRRTAVGPFTEAMSHTLDDAARIVYEADASKLLRPIETALDDIPAVAVDGEEASSLRQGRAIVLLPHQVEALRAKRRPRLIDGADMSRAALATWRGRAIALGDVRAGRFEPFRVFQTEVE